ncbi:glutathione S-transferase [Dactylonectria macrodidyma]|uniref:glutathione transferase n=1 Tax=Dactylonectria macrodidyma TaxID=307937 RepID=A0A9P9IZT1_9HYPO|nr:glutathione S-transferase [Dactylonectria macrodidyma]
MALKLYGDYVSPYTVMVAFTLKEKELNYELVNVQLFKGKRSDLIRPRNPYAKVPIIEFDEPDQKTITVYESRAICRFLALKFKDLGTPLLPPPDDFEAIARFEEAAAAEVHYLFPHVSTYTKEKLVHRILGVPVSEEKLKSAVSDLKATLGIADKLMEGKLYFAGENISLVDIWWAVGIYALLSIERDWLFDLPNLSAWWARIEDRPAWKATLEIIEGHWLKASQTAV